MGFYLPEDGHVVMLFNPADVAAAASSEVFSMENYNHVDILVHKGAGSACTIQLEETDDFTPTNAATITFDYCLESTAAGDTLSAKATATTAGVALGTGTGVMLVISLDSSRLSDGYENVRIKNSAVGTCLLSAVAILSSPRYGKSESVTAIV